MLLQAGSRVPVRLFLVLRFELLDLIHGLLHLGVHRHRDLRLELALFGNLARCSLVHHPSVATFRVGPLSGCTYGLHADCSRPLH